ncbi:zinc-binding alcohol dehydrogenase family protein [Chryseobacterium sp. FH1]|uniref:quinone oxidoreductase family protein n=1 Tax=Chryseobacterium sp. FH1 TaxID=1233951 RepID=UPI0004E29375|nr:zinc-binding alcohol dehydrogenase family protein [Chryseobacterium sp. FH1]KFC19935.1 alcohol dehydrogenase [Chryseobacterium sp. FH1]
MKAIILDDNNQLKDETVTLRPINPEEVRIKILASGFNPIDYQMRENEHEKRYLFSNILGREGSGIIVETGQNVNLLKIDDEVFFVCGSMGSNRTYAEEIILPQAIVAKKPTSISFEETAGLPSIGITALQIFNRVDWNQIENVVITGASGGVGNFVLRLILGNLNKKIVVTAGNQESIKQLIEIGLNENQIVNYNQDNLAEKILEINQNQKFDLVIDAVGHQLSEISADVLKANGIYANVTHFITPKASDSLFGVGATILNISNFIYAKEKNYNHFRKSLNQIKQYIDDGKVKSLPIKIIGGLSSETAEKAQQLLKNNQTQGKKLIMQNQE